MGNKPAIAGLWRPKRRDDALGSKEGIDLRDQSTPDDWIARDPALERLTGNHPFNAETPLRVLAGDFLTTARQGYVRNHGAVPRLDWATHRLHVRGLGLPQEGRVLTMEEIASLPSREVAVTFCCSGNRRREVNAVKPSIGVPFGAGAVRTGVFRGVSLVELFKHVGFEINIACRQCAALRHHDHHTREGPCFINFAGPGNELAKGEYGTSLLLGYALDPTNDVLIAYAYNGEPLMPDHGFPVRLVIPGYIGGRMIKWLSCIEVAPYESKSHYYFHDNRLFPGTVTLDRATREGWWHRAEYIIGEMNINSAVTWPAHGDIIEVGDLATQEVTIRGFAYSGGGRRIVIVEVSLDAEGEHWTPAEFVDHALDKPNGAGKFWTWRLWKHTVKLSRLAAAPSVHVRAWDASFNTQPAEIAWNVLGMMNNSRYKVEIETCRSREGRDAITFFHPLPPHEVNLDKGFGRPPCEVEERPRPQVAPAPTAGTAGRFTRREVAKHSNEGDLWLIVNGRVYDVTTFLNDHPGGAGIITINGGRVCQEFDDIHSKHAHKLLKDYYRGELVEEKEKEVKAEEEGEEQPPQPAQPQQPRQEEEAVFLDPATFKPCPLIEKENVSHDTRRFRFGLAHPDQAFGLPLGHHIYLRATIDDEMVLRPYTPTSVADQRGSFDLVVKIYAAGQDPKHPRGGKMSLHLDRLQLGDTIDVKGPVGRLVYHGRGQVEIAGHSRRVTRLGMVAGGTGITPIFQLLQAILRDPEDATRCALLFANKAPHDILLRPELDQLAARAQGEEDEGREKEHEHGGDDPRLKVWYTVDRLPREDHAAAAWPFSIGHVDADMMAAHLPPPGPGTLILLCGPPPMVHYACRPALEKLGFGEEQVFEF